MRATSFPDAESRKGRGKMSQECSRCLLNGQVPGVQIHADGLCSVCTSSDRAWDDWNRNKSTYHDQLLRMFDKARRRRRPYDALVPLSGGKDSTYVLYLCTKRFNLRCLAVTWDNGFLSEFARRNIENTVSKLNVDHLYYGLNHETLMKLYRLFFLKTGIFCSVCMRGIATTVGRTARAFDIPLIIAGTSLKTEEHVSPEFFESGELSYFKNVLAGEDLYDGAEPLMYGNSWFHILERALTTVQINLPDYVEWDYDEIFRTISSELDWHAHSDDAEHSDCLVDNIVHFFRYAKFPALVPEMLRFSKLVTIGRMTRQEAESRVFDHREAVTEPENLQWFLDRLNITASEMDQVLADPLRHMGYFGSESRVRQSLRTVKRRVVDPLLGRG
jgi:hypothetical protein